ncbi:MAG: hypothetical protein JSR91_13565 [Proteobacteria bacterium]|nr:hypothetical protein [Pseudomonadota bacterium]
MVDAAVHRRLSRGRQQMMLNFPVNAAIRTSSADFLVITGGDILFGEKLCHQLARGEVRRGCLYRAERVNIRSDLDFEHLSPAVVEDPAGIVSVDTCHEAPFDQPPFINASGDFIMMDRATLTGLRGMDEGIDFARLHLDSRMSTNALQAGLDCQLLGQIFHISHSRSFSRMPSSYPDHDYTWDCGLPYLNGDNWGLADRRWRRLSDRIWHVSDESTGAEDSLPQTRNPDLDRWAAKLGHRLQQRRKSQRTETPSGTIYELALAPARHGFAFPEVGLSFDGQLTASAHRHGLLASFTPRQIGKALARGERRWVGLDLEVEAGELIVCAGGEPLGRQATIGAGTGRHIVWFEATPGMTAIDLRRFRAGEPAPRAQIAGTITAANFADDKRRFVRGISGRVQYFWRRLLR